MNETDGFEALLSRLRPWKGGQHKPHDGERVYFSTADRKGIGIYRQRDNTLVGELEIELSDEVIWRRILIVAADPTAGGGLVETISALQEALLEELQAIERACDERGIKATALADSIRTLRDRTDRLARRDHDHSHSA